jgi:hypothetical protein
MTRRPFAASVALAALLLGAARSDAGVIVVETLISDASPPVPAPDVALYSAPNVRASIASTGPTGLLNNPYGVALGPDGNVYVTNQGTSSDDPNRNSVVKIPLVGNTLGAPTQLININTPPGPQQTPPTTDLNSPTGIIFAPTNLTPGSPTLLVANATPSGAGYIAGFTTAGTFVNVAGNPFGILSTSVPQAVAFDRLTPTPSGQGAILVTNIGTVTNPVNTVTFYDAGNVAANLSNPFISTHLNIPTGLAIDAAGNIFVANFGDNSIQEFNASGVFIKQLASDSNLNNPFGLAFDTTVGDPFFGDLLVANFAGGVAGAGSIRALNPLTGADLGAYATGLNGPTFIAVTAAIPEPGSMAMMGLGQLGLIGYLARRGWKRPQAD